MSDATPEEADEINGIVLDFLPHGRADDDRPRYQKRPLAHVLGEAQFQLFELALADDPDVNIGDRLRIDPPDSVIESAHELGYDELSTGARSELEYVVQEIIDGDEKRFVDVYNDAQPITLRLHQLNLLPGIGKKLRNTILDERKRGPFESFDELEERINGLHDPKGILVDRIMEELRDESLKYRMFVRREQ